MVSLRRGVVPTLLSCLIVFVVNAQSDSEESSPIFYVGKKPVSTEEFLYLYRKNHQHKPEEFTNEKISEYFELFINYKLKVEEALSRGMDTTSAFRKEFDTYRDELLKPYLPEGKVIDSLVSLTYERLKEEINASHILVRLTPDAPPKDTLDAYNRISELRRRAAAGEDFGKLAAEFSEEPGASTTKGNLGYFTAMQMVFPFEQAAWRTSVGGVSTPVRTRFGYHIVKVHDRQPTRGEVEVSHIMIRVDAGADDNDARNKIFDVHDKLQKGMSWEELCSQYSEDPNSKDRGGRLKPFGVGAMASVPKFQDMAFSLQEPGDISDPIRTQFGWHILRLEAKIPLPPLEEMQASLTQRVSRDERAAISKEVLRERMRREFNYTEKDEVKQKLFELADSILQGNTSGAMKMSKQPLFTMGGTTAEVGDFIKFVSEQASLPESDAARHLDQLFTAYVDKIQIGLMEEKVKMQSPDYKWLLKEYYEGILLFEIMEQEVWNKAMEDTTGQRSYYNRHAQKYQAGERMVGKIYSTSLDGRLEELKAMIEKGDAGIHDFISINRIRQDSGAFEQKDRTILSKEIWAPGLYLTENNGVHYLVAIEKILPPGSQTFEEARASVISDYQTYLEDSWIRELKRKFAVKVEKKAKKRAFAQLTDQKGKV